MKALLKTIDSVPVGDDVIDKLEQVLARARTGNVSMIAIAVVDRDGSSASCRSHCHNYATMLGSIELMKARLIADVDA